MLLITKDGQVETGESREPVTFASLSLGMKFRTDGRFPYGEMIKLPPYGEMGFNAIGMRGLGWRIAEDEVVIPIGQVWHIQEAK